MFRMEPQDRVEREMSRMGYKRVREPLKAQGVCRLYYDLIRIQTGANPEAVRQRIAEMNEQPEELKWKYKLIPNTDMPGPRER